MNNQNDITSILILFTLFAIGMLYNTCHTRQHIPTLTNSLLRIFDNQHFTLKMCCMPTCSNSLALLKCPLTYWSTADWSRCIYDLNGSKKTSTGLCDVKSII